MRPLFGIRNKEEKAIALSALFFVIIGIMSVVRAYVEKSLSPNILVLYMVMILIYCIFFILVLIFKKVQKQIFLYVFYSCISINMIFAPPGNVSASVLIAVIIIYGMREGIINIYGKIGIIGVYILVTYLNAQRFELSVMQIIKNVMFMGFALYFIKTIYSIDTKKPDEKDN